MRFTYENAKAYVEPSLNTAMSSGSHLGPPYLTTSWSTRIYRL